MYNKRMEAFMDGLLFEECVVSLDIFFRGVHEVNVERANICGYTLTRDTLIL